MIVLRFSDSIDSKDLPRSKGENFLSNSHIVRGSKPAGEAKPMSLLDSQDSCLCTFMMYALEA